MPGATPIDATKQTRWAYDAWWACSRRGKVQSVTSSSSRASSFYTTKLGWMYLKASSFLRETYSSFNNLKFLHIEACLHIKSTPASTDRSSLSITLFEQLDRRKARNLLAYIAIRAKSVTCQGSTHFGYFCKYRFRGSMRLILTRVFK